MLVAIDVAYGQDGGAVAAAVAFARWDSAAPDATFVRRIDRVAPYRPGRFFERELPCVMAVLELVPGRPHAVVIDGHVTLGKERRDGLGAHLFRALGCTIPVIGVAKSAFVDTPPDTELLRGASAKPLYVTSMGIEAEAARACIRSMHGDHRMPTILAVADRTCRRALEGEIARGKGAAGQH